MIPMIPSYITALTIAAEIVIAIAVWSVLSRAAGRSGLPSAAQRRVRIGAALFFGAWIGAALIFAPAPSSLIGRDPYSITPLIPLFDGLSIATALVALWRSSSLRRVVASVPLPALHAMQSWRIFGIVFVVLLELGQLPAHFALPAGWGDIFVGLTAPFVALALARGARGAATAAVAWNIFGLLDLVVAVGMGTGLLAPLLVPGLGPRVPPAAAMGQFPMMLVPAFAVPVSTLVHLIALGRLRRDFRLRAGVLSPMSVRELGRGS